MALHSAWRGLDELVEVNLRLFPRALAYLVQSEPLGYSLPLITP